MPLKETKECPMCKSLGETVNQIHVLNGEIVVPKNNIIIQVIIEPGMEDVYLPVYLMKKQAAYEVI